MAEAGPIGYQVTIEGEEQPPHTVYLVPPAKGTAREDQFYALAGGEQYKVRLMRPAEVKEYLAVTPQTDQAVSLEAAAALSGSPFMSNMLHSMGLTCRVINQGTAASQRTIAEKVR